MIRLWYSFRFILTVYLLFLRRGSFFGLRPLDPDKLLLVTLNLGCTFVKLAQVLATRADFFAPEYLLRLKTVHDRLTPMSEADFQAVFQIAFPTSPFIFFETRAMSSATIGQVHKARLKTGETVAVKLRRKGVKRQILHDLKLLRFFQNLLQPFLSSDVRESIENLLLTFSQMILKEVDLHQEMKNLQQFHKRYPDSKVRLPQVYPEYSKPDCLVLEFIEGVRVDDETTLKAWNLEFKTLLADLLDFYVEQMMIQGYFHADPHPGNLLVNQKGQLILLDFGMVARIPDSVRVALIAVVKAAHDRNYQMLVESYRDLGVITELTPQQELEDFIERMFEIFSNDSLNAQSMQALGFEVLDSMRMYEFRLPQEVIYVIRASALLEGLGTTYVENFNGIKDILPLLRQNLGRALTSQSVWDEIDADLRNLPLYFRKFKRTLNQLVEGNLEIRLSKRQLQVLEHRMMLQIRRAVFAFCCLGLALVMIFLQGVDVSPMLCAALFFAIIGFWNLIRL